MGLITVLPTSTYPGAGIALTLDEKALVIKEAKEILDVEDVIASILIVDDLRIQKN